ncbi:MAG: PhoH family protein [Deltaproteobacteria bacterium]|jgi:phosphate starvation-inducible PhoH-like protein|nr:PhoH family protein [Deltaproteobacteria bacterium]
MKKSSAKLENPSLVNEKNDSPRSFSDNVVTLRPIRMGADSANIRILSEILEFKVGQRGSEVFLLDLDPNLVSLGRKALSALDVMPTENTYPSLWEVECLANLLKNHPDIDLDDFFLKSQSITKTKSPVFSKTLAQRAFITTIRSHSLTFGLGPAGTGKTFLAVALAVEALINNDVKRIVLTRPAVEAGENLGYLPGDLKDKMHPYLRPLFDALSDLMPFGLPQVQPGYSKVEIAPLAYMRGRTLSDAFVILDEAQNASKDQIKMFLTRLGPGSRAVITGDPSQSDRTYGSTNGLLEAAELLKKIPGIAVFNFSHRDTVRHRLVRQILYAYEELEREKKKAAAPLPQRAAVSPSLETSPQDPDPGEKDLKASKTPRASKTPKASKAPEGAEEKEAKGSKKKALNVKKAPRKP